MFSIFRRRHRNRANPRRGFRPLLESLESRELLAFNLTISTAPTNSAVTSTFDAATSTTTFKSAATGANLRINDINDELFAGHNVVVTTAASTAAEAGSISMSGIADFQFKNVSGTTLTIKNAPTGTLAALADVTLSGLQLSNPGTLAVQANDNVVLSNQFKAATMSLTATGGSITMPPGGELQAANLILTANTGIGTSGVERVHVNVDSLTTDTSSGNGFQYLDEADGLTAMNLNSGAGNIFFNAHATVSDNDSTVDFAAASLQVQVLGVGNSFGTTVPIQTKVDELEVVAGFAGNELILQSKALTSLHLAAADVTLTVASGAVVDTDNFIDIDAVTANVAVNAAGADFGLSKANPIQTAGNELRVATNGGDQFIVTENGPKGIELDAGTGNITLDVVGNLTDDDTDIDIVAASATVTTGGGDVGSATHRLQTAVDDLTVTTNTSSASGNQFLDQAFTGLKRLNLNAGSANVDLVVVVGNVSDDDSDADIAANAAIINLLNNGISHKFGTSAHPIDTKVNDLTVLCGGDQFITEADGLTALRLDTSNSQGVGATVALTVTSGAVTDSDSSQVDIVGDVITIILGDATAQDFGTASNPINTVSGDSLTVNTAGGGGSQFIAETNTIGSLSLNAASGDVSLVVQLGSLSDDDGTLDILASTVSVTLNDSAPRNFGSSTHPITTRADFISVNTATGGGNIFLSEQDAVTVNHLDAGSGDINLFAGTFNLLPSTGITNAISDESTVILNSPAVLSPSSALEVIGGLAGDGSIAFKADGAFQQFNVGNNDLEASRKYHRRMRRLRSSFTRCVSFGTREPWVRTRG